MHSYYNCYSGKAISITYSAIVFVALGTRHAWCIANCRLWPALLYNIFSHYLINGTIFEKKNEHKICFDFLFNFFSEIFLILRRIERNMIKKRKLVSM